MQSRVLGSSVSREVLRPAPVYCASFTRQRRLVPLLACICIVSCWHGLGNVQTVAARPIVEGAARFSMQGELVAGISRLQIQKLEFVPAKKSLLQGAVSYILCRNVRITR